VSAVAAAPHRSNLVERTLLNLEETSVPYLATTIVLMGVLCLLDLLSTVGMIRRLRLHTGLLDDQAVASGWDVDGLPARTMA
jgi:hypothetical protein